MAERSEEFRRLIAVLSPEETQALSRKLVGENADADGTYRIENWLEGKEELEDDKIENLVRVLPLVWFERKRIGIAEKWGVRAGVLDRIRKVKNGEAPDIQQGQAVMFQDPEPWPEPVSGALLLDDLRRVFERYIVLPPGASAALALWTAYSYVYDNFSISPVLSLVSPTKRCGKTTSLTILSRLVRRPMALSNVTAASLFRSVEAFTPVLLADEYETYSKDNEELRGVVNSGHLRHLAYVARCNGENNEIRLFSTWCPKVISLIGWPASTIRDRSIIIQLHRKGRKEVVERLRLNRADPCFEDLRRKLMRWAGDVSGYLKDAEPEIPAFLSDREADNWEPLLAVAEACPFPREEDKDRWMKEAAESARLLTGEKEPDDAYDLLLYDLKKLFEEAGSNRLSSADIVEKLLELEDRPWSEWKGKGLTKHQLARILGAYGVKSIDIKFGKGTTLKGYYFSDLAPLFERYTRNQEDNSQKDKEIAGCGTIAGCDSKTQPEELLFEVAEENATRNRTATKTQPANSLYNKEMNGTVAEVADKQGGLGDIANGNLEQALADKGYVRIRSEILEEEIIITADSAKVPAECSELTVYTLDELNRLKDLSEDQVQNAHRVKKAFNGEVIA